MHMTAEIRHEIDEGRYPSMMSPSLRRALVFLLLGPMLGVFAVLLSEAVYGGMGSFLGLIMGLAFVLGLQVAAVAALADGLLSRSLPIALRAPLTAVTGAMTGIGMLNAMFGPLPQDMFLPIGGGAAFCAAVCSLLSHDWRGSKA
jgi:hypothetical protein